MSSGGQQSGVKTAPARQKSEKLTTPGKGWPATYGPRHKALSNLIALTSGRWLNRGRLIRQLTLRFPRLMEVGSRE